MPKRYRKARAAEGAWTALSGGPCFLQAELQAKALDLLRDALEGKGQLFHHFGARAEPGHWARAVRGNHRQRALDWSCLYSSRSVAVCRERSQAGVRCEVPGQFTFL